MILLKILAISNAPTVGKAWFCLVWLVLAQHDPWWPYHAWTQNTGKICCLKSMVAAKILPVPGAPTVGKAWFCLVWLVLAQHVPWWPYHAWTLKHQQYVLSQIHDSCKNIASFKCTYRGEGLVLPSLDCSGSTWPMMAIPCMDTKKRQDLLTQIHDNCESIANSKCTYRGEGLVLPSLACFGSTRPMMAIPSMGTKTPSASAGSNPWYL